MAHKTPSNYEAKFADFVRLCRDAKLSETKMVVIAHPSVIGDTYAEVIESLSRLAKADLKLAVTAPEMPATNPRDPGLN
jgi:hypothetical protein